MSSSLQLTPTDKANYDRDGYVIVRGLFSEQEIGLLNQAIRVDPDFAEKGMKLKDAEGGVVNLALWNDPGDDLFGALVRCKRMANGMSLLLDGESYHYHSKLTAKMPNTKGAWDWHQDYGYWYDNGLLYPNAASVMVALDATDEENGCLQVIKGSHLMGRIDHKLTQHQMGADVERVDQILKTHERVYVKLQPGDAVFFHCNTLHRSDSNRSDRTRNTLVCSYNRFDNSSFREHQHPNFTKLDVLPDSALIDIGLTDFGKARELFSQPDNFEVDG